MRLSGWFPVAAVVLVLTAAPPGQAQGIPDEATRDRVADWIERCDGDWSGACGRVDDYIVERMLGRWCRRLEAHWDTPRLVRSADVDHPAAGVADRHRHRAQEFLEECVPIYAAALARAGTAASDRADAGGGGPRDAGERWQVAPADRMMQAAKRSNLRSGPGTEHDKVGLLEVGEQVRVTGEVGDWLRIEAAGGGEAFIYGPLLAEAAPRETTAAAAPDEADGRDDSAREAGERWQVAPADQLMQAVTRSNMRSGPSVAHDLVGLLEVGDQVRVTGVVGDWLRIEVPGVGEAFVYGEPLAEVPVRETTAAAPSRPNDGSDPGMPDAATRERVAERRDDCLSMWRALVPWGATDERYAGEQGMRKFLADMQEADSPIVATISRFITMCRAVGDKVEQSGRSCREMTREMFRTITMARATVADITRNPDYYLDPDGPLDEAGRRLVEQYHRICVTAYAAVLDGRLPDDVPAPGGHATVGQTGPLHGSIAFSQDDDGAYAWGIAWSFDSAAGAQSEALGQCREYGGTQCAQAGWFQEACGALAIGSVNGYGAGWGVSIADAERDALARCRAVNDDCRIEVARCSQSEEAGGRGQLDNEDTAESEVESKMVTLEGFSSSGIVLGPGMQAGTRVLSAEDFTFELPQKKYACHSAISSLIASCLEWNISPDGSVVDANRQCANHFKDEGLQKCGLTPEDDPQLGIDYRSWPP